MFLAGLRDVFNPEKMLYLCVRAGQADVNGLRDRAGKSESKVEADVLRQSWQIRDGPIVFHG